MTRLFVTGATGYIGGDALSAIANAHPEYDITCLVRSSAKGAKVAVQYPKVRFVYGNLDHSDLLAEEAARADIVCHFADADHPGSAAALMKGLQKHTPMSPGYMIHTSGTGILTVDDMQRSTYGASAEKVYDDWDGLGVVTSLTDAALHRDVDKIVLEGSSNAVKTAIVCPPTIYGPGRGPDNTRSNQVYNMAMQTLKMGHAFQVGEGKSIWCEIHVHDLSNLYLALVEQAASCGGSATWGTEGYYFAENGEFVWGDIAKTIAESAHKEGLIKDKEVKSLSVEDANALMMGIGAILWGTNSRSKAVRARKLLGWTPSGRPLKEMIPEIVEGEAKALGLIKGHAAQAAGV